MLFECEFLFEHGFVRFSWLDGVVVDALLYIVELFVVEFGMHRQAQHCLCESFGIREVSLVVSAVLICFLHV